MYDIAMTVTACLQAGTRADVAWVVGAEGLAVPDWSDAVVFTPGGGRTGSLLEGAIDGKLIEQAGRLSKGRLVDLEITQVDVLIAELPSTGSVRCILAPADTLPAELWSLAVGRERFGLVLDLDGDEVVDVSVYSQLTVSEADRDVRESFADRPSGSVVTDSRVISVFEAVPQMVIVGGGPIADALAELAPLVGWQAQIAASRDMATGLITPLSSHDKVVIAAHDLELAGSGLTAALESSCGYIGSVGSRKMQADRADWLAYRGITDLSRVHGPAGLDIGAANPGEVAVAIVAEAIASGR
ncbi:MAG TPA: XdhC family protein [Acidimicrobiia bacterium]